jgi:amino acid transporter
MQDEARLFVRKTTGLVRELSVFDGFVLNSGQIAAACFWVLFYWVGAFPQSNLALAMIVGFVPIMLIGLVYSQLGAAMPRSGGDYVYVSRIIHPALGFVVSFFFLFYWTLTAGAINAGAQTVPIFAVFFDIGGTLLNNQILLNLGIALNETFWNTVAGIVVIVLATSLTVLNVKKVFKAMALMLFISFAGLAVFGIVSLAVSNSAFIAQFESANQAPGLYQSIISKAVEAGYSSGWTMRNTLTYAMPYVFLMLGGYTLSTYTGGEIKKASKSLPVSIISSILVGAIMYSILFALSYNMIGYDFLNGANFLYYSAGSSSYPLSRPPTIPYLLTGIALNPVLILFIEFAFLIGGFWLTMTSFPVGARILFSWAFDRVVPSKVADVNDRWHTPHVATAICGIGAIVCLILYNYTDWFANLLNLVIGYTFVTAIVMVVGMLLPFRKTEIWSSSPSITRTKIGKIPVITILGAISVFYLMYVIWAGVSAATITLDLPSIAVPLSVMLFAAGLFYLIRAYRKRNGIDLDLIFKQIPEE